MARGSGLMWKRVKSWGRGRRQGPDQVGLTDQVRSLNFNLKEQIRVS